MDPAVTHLDKFCCYFLNKTTRKFRPKICLSVPNEAHSCSFTRKHFREKVDSDHALSSNFHRLVV